MGKYLPRRTSRDNKAYIGRFSYKCIGGNAVDEEGTPDNVEFLNLSKDDILSYPKTAHRTYPPLVNKRMDSIVKPFVEVSIHVTNVLISALNDQLGLPAGTLAALHSREKPSGSEIRIIKKSPSPNGTEEKAAALAAHTDFGSLVTTLLILRIILLTSCPVFFAQSNGRSSGPCSRKRGLAVHKGMPCSTRSLHRLI